MTKIFNATASRVVGKGSKVKKVDKSMKDKESFIDRLFGGFLFGGEMKHQRIVMDLTEDKHSKVLFAGISEVK